MSKIDVGGSFQDLPYPKYKEFFAKFNEIDTLPVSEWKPVHLIGLFCKLYKLHYNLDYKFKFNSSAPSKSYEVVQIKKIAQNLTSDPVKLKKYIEWAFHEKVKTAKKRITSIAFLSHEFMITEYKLKYLAGDLRDQKIDRTTTIPQEYNSIVISSGYNISTYGDLAFLLQMNSPSVENLILQLRAAGLDVEAVKRIA